MSRHVVFGTGQVGQPLLEQLVARGPRCPRRQPQRSRRFPRRPGRWRRRDRPRLHHRDLRRSGRRLLLPQRGELRPLARGVPALAGGGAGRCRRRRCAPRRARQPLCLRAAPGPRLVETMASDPTSAKSATRAAMTDELLNAHKAGQVEVAIGRASDYFGPGATRSALGETVFGPRSRARPHRSWATPTSCTATRTPPTSPPL